MYVRGKHYVADDDLKKLKLKLKKLKKEKSHVKSNALTYFWWILSEV